MADCPFCPPPSERIFHEDRYFLAILDSYPVSPGHTLVIPRRHVSSLFDLSSEELGELVKTLAAARAILLERHAPDSFNIGVNDGKAAGQTIDHAHLHLIPRYAGDVPDARGGVRWVIPDRAAYWTRGR